MRKLAFLAALMFGGWLAFSVLNPPVDGIRFFDIGQGDAAMVSVGRTQLLVDGGPDRSVLAPVGGAMPVFDRRIEYVVLSHPHTDHYRGLIDVVRRYDVGTLIVGVPGEEPEYRDFIAEAERRGATVIRAAGQHVTLGPGVRVDVLDPVEPLSDKPVEDPNNASVVMLVTIGRSRVLMTGDAGFEQERRLLAAGLNLDVDILKVGHHGSKTSSSTDLLEAVTPRDAVVSVAAENRYNHPTKETLDRLAGSGARVLRTDERGTVTVRFNQGGYQLGTEK